MDTNYKGSMDQGAKKNFPKDEKKPESIEKEEEDTTTGQEWDAEKEDLGEDSDVKVEVDPELENDIEE